MAPLRRFLLVPLLLLTLGGCKLIDQTTFDPDAGAEAPPVAIAPARAANQIALISIRYDTANPVFQDQLAFAVRAAEQRMPGRDYDVVGVSTAADAAQASRDSLAVMDAMTGLGIATARLHLGARIDPAQTVREVRVYLR